MTTHAQIGTSKRITRSRYDCCNPLMVSRLDYTLDGGSQQL